MRNCKVSVVIPCWNGKKLLEKNLASVLALNVDEVIIVDDASEDNSVTFLKKHYPQVKIICHQVNLGFAKSCNDGFAAATGEVVILLNQDVLPSVNLLAFVLPHFKDRQVFAVSFHERQWSWGKIVWKNGFIEHLPGKKTKGFHISGWASGGSAAFNRKILTQLRGFDLLYHPFYWEDLDLGYRAWKRGYKIIWEPKALVEHKHEASIGSRYSKNYVDFISNRNQLLFIWKNISERQLIFDHGRSLVARCFTKPGYIKIVLAALAKLPAIIPRRWQEKKDLKVSDRQILDLFHN